LRQIGGSVGLAVFATLLSRYAVQAKASISASLDPGRTAVVERMTTVTSALVGRGMDPDTASQTAHGMLAGVVARQSMLLSFEKLFLLSGILFLGVLPILIFLKAKRVDGAPRPHIELE